MNADLLSLAVFWILYTIAGIIVLMAILFALRRFLLWANLEPLSLRSQTIRVTVPKNLDDEEERKRALKDKLAAAETMFSTIAGLAPQKGLKAFLYGRNDNIAFEIVADHDGLVTFFVTVPHHVVSYAQQQILAQYPDAHLEVVEDYNIFSPNGHIVGGYMMLKKAYLFPINTYVDKEVDYLNALTNVLGKLQPTEGACIQFLIRSTKKRWHKWGTKVAREMQKGKTLKKALKATDRRPLRMALRGMGEARSFVESQTSEAQQQTRPPYQLSPMEQEMVKRLETKSSKAGFDVNIRVVVSAKEKLAAQQNLRRILDTFSQYGGYEYLNGFRSVVKGENKKLIHQFIYRAFDSRQAMILNTEEMATLYHFPLATTETPNIRWLMAKKAPPPVNLPKDGIILGKVTYRGSESLVRMKRDDRRRHTYIIGKSGSGKSVLQASMIIQDIQNGEGVAVVDPHGELIEDILPHIPKERAEDVVIFDPSDLERPVGLNMLEGDNEAERDFAVQEMVAIFYKLFGEEMIGPMFEHYMRNAMLALMEDQDAGATILEIPRMFTDSAYRKQKLAKVTNPVVKNFWEQEYEQSQRGQQSADMLSYVISKIGRFLSNRMMRNIVGQRVSGFNFREIMDQRKIFLVNLSKGKIGEVNSRLLGFIIVTKLQMAAMARAEIESSKRRDFYLYLDEFQNFTTESIATILSEARKYLLDLIIAHQYIGQLEEKGDESIKNAVFGNVGTMITFRIGVEDAEFLQKEFEPTFTLNDLVNVEQYTANIKLLIDNTASLPFNMKTIYPPKGNMQLKEPLKQLSRLKYGRDRGGVELEIEERAQLGSLGRRAVAPPELSR